MPEKIGAGNEPQKYDESNGRYEGDGGAIRKAVDNYKPSDLKAEVDKYSEDDDFIQSSNKKLSSKEYAIWSSMLASELHGDHIKNLPDGHKVIRLNNKVIFSSGDFEKPKIDKVIAFGDELELTIFMELL